MIMSQLRLTTREIGSVKIFDLMGDTTHDSLQEVAWKIQRSIRRHRLQRVILNVQKIKSLDEIGVRKLVAAFLRPQKSAFYGASGSVKDLLEDTYLPHNIRICPTEKEVAEDFGPFLFNKDERGKILGEKDRADNGHGQPGPGILLERRRAKRMHVAIPLEMTLHPKGQDPVATRAISTNISEGGIFVEFLDLDAIKLVEKLDPQGLKVEVQIHPSENFPEEYHLEGIVRRREVHKGGLGLAVEFVSAA